MINQNEELLKDDLKEYKRRLQNDQKVNKVMQNIISEYIDQINESEHEFEIPVEPFLIAEEMENFNNSINKSTNIAEIGLEITKIMQGECEYILRCLREYTNMNFEIVSSENVAILVKFIDGKTVIDFERSYVKIKVKFS